MFELRLLCGEDQVETLGDALEALDALSVSVEDADAQTDAEQALFGEPGLPAPREGWQRSRVLALFPQREAAEEAARLLQAQDFFAGCTVLGIEEVAEQGLLGIGLGVGVLDGDAQRVERLQRIAQGLDLVFAAEQAQFKHGRGLAAAQRL